MKPDESRAVKAAILDILHFASVALLAAGIISILFWCLS